MRIFVYEYLTALELGQEPTSPVHGMYREGLAMREALLADLQSIHGIVASTVTQIHSNSAEEELRQAIRDSDLQIVIAPESGGILAQLVEVVRHEGNPVACDAAAIQLTSDKLALANHWRASGIPTPATSEMTPNECVRFPVIWKPRDGAGSTATFLLQNGFDAISARALVEAGEYDGSMILQEFIPGQAASIAFLCGPRGNYPLVPAYQNLTVDGRFHYLGGHLPIPTVDAARAIELATRALAVIPGLAGYMGVDLILGDRADGSRDYAIEVNPRLTTSYLGLRALAGFNLAEAMLAIATGENPPTFRWRDGEVNFSASGEVT